MKLIIFLGIIFFILDKVHFPCTRSVPIHHDLLHLLHNMTAIMIYIAPFIYKNLIFMKILLISTTMILIQGAINPNKEQSCVLMPIYNKQCGLPENRSLYDIFSLIQLKQVMTLGEHIRVYYLTHAVIFTYLLNKIIV